MVLIQGPKGPLLHILSSYGLDGWRKIIFEFLEIQNLK
jgi:hypothetical protein